MTNNKQTDLREEIERFKIKMRRVETLLKELNEENRDLRNSFSNLVKLINHEVIASLTTTSEILKKFKI